MGFSQFGITDGRTARFGHRPRAARCASLRRRAFGRQHTGRLRRVGDCGCRGFLRDVRRFELARASRTTFRERHRSPSAASGAQHAKTAIPLCEVTPTRLKWPPMNLCVEGKPRAHTSGDAPRDGTSPEPGRCRSTRTSAPSMFGPSLRLGARPHRHQLFGRPTVPTMAAAMIFLNAAEVFLADCWRGSRRTRFPGSSPPLPGEKKPAGRGVGCPGELPFVSGPPRGVST
jgi:hypothetical protein